MNCIKGVSIIHGAIAFTCIFDEDNFDIAIRGQKPKDCKLIARKLEDSELIVVATPIYLQNMGLPVMLEDLKKHNCIEFELPSTGRKTL